MVTAHPKDTSLQWTPRLGGIVRALTSELVQSYLHPRKPPSPAPPISSQRLPPDSQKPLRT